MDVDGDEGTDGHAVGMGAVGSHMHVQGHVQSHADRDGDAEMRAMPDCPAAPLFAAPAQAPPAAPRMAWGAEAGQTATQAGERVAPRTPPVVGDKGMQVGDDDMLCCAEVTASLHGLACHFQHVCATLHSSHVIPARTHPLSSQLKATPWSLGMGMVQSGDTARAIEGMKILCGLLMEAAGADAEVR